MRKLFLIIAVALLHCAVVMAQSKAITIARVWNVGDVMHYEKEAEALRISFENDTTVKSHTTSDFYLRVVDKNESEYTLRLDYPTSMYAQMLPNLKSLSTKEHLSLLFTTDLTGSFKELKNYDDLRVFFDEVIDAMYSPEKFPGVTKEEYLAQMKRILSPELQVATMMKDIEIILWQNGLEAEDGHSYEFDSSVSVGNTVIPTKITLSLEVDPNDGYPIYMVDTVTNFDKSTLAPFVSSFLQEVLMALKEQNKIGDNDLQDFFAQSDISLTDYNYSLIPAENGCVYVTRYIREIVLTTSLGKTQEIRYTKICMVE